jgi:molybdopterin molybdotransferase
MTIAAGLLSVEAVREAVLGAVGGPLPAERIEVDAVLGRVVAESVRATTDLPPWDNSAMDGYAVRAADTMTASEASPIRLRIVGEVAAGASPTIPVGPGEAIRIATGAPVPAGSDAVVPVESTTPLGLDGLPSGPRGRDAAGPLPAACLVHEAVRPGASIRPRGDDLEAGAVLVEQGTEATPAVVALLAGSGVASIPVHRRPRVAVLATGDEIRAPGEPLGPAGIPDANGPGLAALATAAGCDVIRLGVARDDLDDVTGRLRAALPEADVVIVSGGVSVGPYDVVRSAFDTVGRVDLWRVAVQPGKPFAFGVTGSAVPLFGLPGNPVSTFVTYELFVRPVLRRLAGHRDLLRPLDRCVLDTGVGKSAGRRTFLRVTAERDSDGLPLRDAAGRVHVRLAGGQGSHVLSALAMADGLAVVPETAASAEPGIEYALWWIDH